MQSVNTIKDSSICSSVPFVLIATACLFLWPALCSAQEDEQPLVTDRPDLTESASTVGHLRLQIETGFSWERYDDRLLVTEHYFMPTLFRFGIGDELELRLETDAFSRMDTGGESIDGFAPAAIGFKYNFVVGTDFGAPTTGLLISVGVPSGTSDFETNDYSYALKFLASWEFNEILSLGTNVGFTREKDDAGEDFHAMMATASLGMAASERLGTFVEVAFTSAESSRAGAAVLADGGLTWLIHNNLQLDFAAGAALAGEESPDYFLTAGLSTRF